MLLDYATLRLIWWALLGVLLSGFAIMDGFDLGVAMLHPFVARTDGERRVAMNAIGPVWEGNQIWFVLGGGAVFAAWPLLYAASFSGFYLAMMLVLIGFILRPVALTFRSKLESPLWRTIWDYAFFISGLVPSLVFGVAFGNLLLGAPFHFEKGLRLVYEGNLLGLLNPFSLLCGLISIAMLVMQGASFLATKTEGEITKRARRCGSVAASALLLLFTFAGIWVALGVDGYAVQGAVNMSAPSNPLLKSVVQEHGAWLANYRRMPLSFAAPLLAYLGAISTIVALRANASKISACQQQSLHRRRDHDGGLQPVSLPLAVVQPSGSQPHGLGRLIEPGDSDADAVRGHRLPPHRAELHGLGLSGVPRRDERSRHRPR